MAHDRILYQRMQLHGQSLLFQTHLLSVQIVVQNHQYRMRRHGGTKDITENEGESKNEASNIS